MAPSQLEIQAFTDGFESAKAKYGVAGEPRGISSEQAHQLAMEAAYTVHQSAIHRGDLSYDEIGTACAKAYLQAYEAVEGWTKPIVPSTPSQKSTKIPVEMKVGSCAELINGVNGHSLHVTLCRDGTWRYDAGMFGGNIPQPKDA